MTGLTRPEITGRLASSAGRNDEAPNIALADALCRDGEPSAVTIVVDILRTGEPAQQNDAIKVLYEIGARDPSLIAPHCATFVDQLRSRNNRLVWGALTSLAAICRVAPGMVADHLDAILDAADNGSVIAKDQAIVILIALKALPDHTQTATEILFDRLGAAATNQLPMYAEQVAVGLKPGERQRFVALLTQRLSDDMPESKRRRLRKVIAKIERMDS